MSDSVIHAKDVSKSYGSTEVLKDISFSVDEGDFLGLVGPNGSGKTTLFNIISGQLKPDTGIITVNGHNVSKSPIEVRKGIGFVPEKESPPSYFTPKEFLTYVGKVRGMTVDERETQIESLAGTLQFTDQLDVYCKNLSRGQQQKVMIAQALLSEPNLILIDEPVANLDMFIQSVVKDVLQDYHEQGNTIVLSSHDGTLIQELCKKGLVMRPDNTIQEFNPETASTDELINMVKTDGD